MEGYTTCGLWMLTLLLAYGRLSAFNLDTENVMRRDGEPNSLFGFSLAMHRQLRPQDKRMLLVGAPQAKAWLKQKSTVTGGLYKCEMDSVACTRVVFDNGEDPTIENKEDQWMGVTVSSQGPGGKVLTCAHRYKRQKNVNTSLETRDIIGRCYVLSQDLTINSRSSEDGGRWHFCDNRNRGHERFGSCQQGLSATFDKDFHYFIFGAPGVYSWKGVVRLEQKNDTFIDLEIYDDGPFEAGDETEKDPNKISVPSNSYMGFSLDSGKSLTTKGQLTVVAGAPRAYYSGAVVLLKTGGQSTRVMLEEYTLKGEGLASSFGYDLTVLDLNGDGWEDIVVGAPQYFEKDSEIGGAVYIYINKAGRWNDVKPTRIDGPADSMFGLAVENLGDINQDGYHDFAVGAPHADSGAGKVYIYHGPATDQIKASQVLSGKSLGVRQFGYSLAGNMDLDGNYYPDLAVGSLSDSVFVYKTRPVVKIEKKITFSPNKIDLNQKNCGNAFCLEVMACFKYDANPASVASTLKVKYDLEVDADRKKNGVDPRGKFIENADPENPHKSTGVIIMDQKESQKCVKTKLLIQNDIGDKLRALPIDVSVNIQNAKRKRRQSQPSLLSPVLDPKDVEKTRTEVEFLKEGCSNDGVCYSKLMLEYRYGYTTADEDTFIDSEIENGVPWISLGEKKSVALKVEVSNLNGDDAYGAFVIAKFPDSMTYSSCRSHRDQLEVTCKPEPDGSSAAFGVGNPFKRDKKTTFYIILDATNKAFNTTEVDIELQLNTTSKQQNLMPVKAKAMVALMLQLSLSGHASPSQVYFDEKAKGKTDIESNTGSAITHRFTIINRGMRLKDIGTVALRIKWPKMTETKKNLLYLMNISSTELKQIKCSPLEEINPLNKKPVDRKKRATDERIKGKLSRLIGDKKSQTLSCDSGAKCAMITCPLGGLDNKASITVTSYLWDSTFAEEFSKFHHVELMVNASLHVDSTKKNTMLQNAETQVRLTVYPERREARYGGVAWWIILLTILFLLLLLALLAFLLWKCGVFGKNKADPSDKEKLTSNS
ncbi:integrin alpha-6 [Fundulus heteroclitus]|uniref:integrin alpha-6 n=1 Tax=Fundulus heteroclitus TaxID=8078 RepID=UPI00165B9BDC|nr:integrin alpha-6 [Fundulus heteroclitus]